MKLLTLLLVIALPGAAQAPLALKDAVALALNTNKSIAASEAATGAAGARIKEARAGFLPQVNYSESWTRSDNPVFVFSSLLTQHQFGEQNFQIGALNQPDFLNNFQSVVSADQVLYDAGKTRHAVRGATLNREMADQDGRRSRMQVIDSVVRAYYGALLSAEQLKAAGQAVSSAEADLQRAQSVRTAGLSTDSDVLSIRVHLASVREQQIRNAADLDVARAALNDALGLPLDTPHVLSTQLEALPISTAALAGYETSAVEERPEARLTKLATNLAENQSASARSNFLPQVTLHGAVEADRQRFYQQGGANWLVSVGLRWNLFNGGGDKARAEEAASELRRTTAQEQQADSAIRLQVRRAFADLDAAQQRIEVAKATVTQAEESLRIIQNRYAAGMSNVTDLLRTETALLEAQTRQLAAVHDQRIAAAALEMAAGTLTADSEVLK